MKYQNEMGKLRAEKRKKEEEIKICEEKRGKGKIIKKGKLLVLVKMTALV